MSNPLLILTVGLPRSGKSTWCLEQMRCHGWPIVSPDSIRLALHGQPFVPQAEPQVWATAMKMVRSLFSAGHQVVILDSTATTKSARRVWRGHEWRVSYKVFETPLDVCLQRAKSSNNPDLPGVIERMALKQQPLGNLEGPLLS